MILEQKHKQRIYSTIVRSDNLMSTMEQIVVIVVIIIPVVPVVIITIVILKAVDLLEYNMRKY